MCIRDSLVPFFLVGQSGTVEKSSFHGDRYIGRQGISYCESHVPYIAHLLGDELSISWREVEPGCDIFYTLDENDFFPEECYVTA